MKFRKVEPNVFEVTLKFHTGDSAPEKTDFYNVIDANYFFGWMQYSKEFKKWNCSDALTPDQAERFKVDPPACWLDTEEANDLHMFINAVKISNLIYGGDTK